MAQGSRTKRNSRQAATSSSSAIVSAARTVKEEPDLSPNTIDQKDTTSYQARRQVPARKRSTSSPRDELEVKLVKQEDASDVGNAGHDPDLGSSRSACSPDLRQGQCHSVSSTLNGHAKPPADFLLPSPYAAAAPTQHQFSSYGSHHYQVHSGYAGFCRLPEPLLAIDGQVSILYPHNRIQHHEVPPAYGDGYQYTYTPHYPDGYPGQPSRFGSGGAYVQDGTAISLAHPSPFRCTGEDEISSQDGLIARTTGPSHSSTPTAELEPEQDSVVSGEDEDSPATLGELQRKLHFYQIMLWLQQSYRMGGQTTLTKRCVYEDYTSMCGAAEIPCLFSPSVFGKVMKRTFPDLQYRRKRINRRIHSHYEGLERVAECFDDAGRPLPLSAGKQEEAERLRLQFQERMCGARQTKPDTRGKRPRSAIPQPLKPLREPSPKRSRVIKGEVDPEDAAVGCSSSSPITGRHGNDHSRSASEVDCPPDQFWRDWALPPPMEPPVGGPAPSSYPSSLALSSSIEQYDSATEPGWLYPGDPRSWLPHPSLAGHPPPPAPSAYQHSHLPSLPPFPLPSTAPASIAALTYSSSSTVVTAGHPCPCPSCLGPRPFHTALEPAHLYTACSSSSSSSS